VHLEGATHAAFPAVAGGCRHKGRKQKKNKKKTKNKKSVSIRNPPSPDISLSLPLRSVCKVAALFWVHWNRRYARYLPVYLNLFFYFSLTLFAADFHHPKTRGKAGIRSPSPWIRTLA
jgi:hypothetical protein